MRKLLALTGALLFHTLLFASSADTAIVEITDATMPIVYYHKITFSSPTKLVFKNLSSVSGYIHFYQNVNLVAVEFPLLKSIGGHFFFYQNNSLQNIAAPNLTTVVDYVSISGNKALTQLQLCNLKQIVPSEDNPMPSYIYYDILNNTPSVDKVPQCFSHGAPTNLALSNDSITENLPVKSFIGKLSASGNANDKISFYFAEDLMDNDNFIIKDDSLLSAKIFNNAAKNLYDIEIGAVNQLGERIVSAYSIKVRPSSVVLDTVVLEIPDTIMSGIYYYNQTFVAPTKLVFKNLRSVDGYVSFHQNVNLVAVEMPLLKNVGGHFNFSGNFGLQSIKAPNLTTVTDYVAIYGNKALTQLQICNLKQIVPSEDNPMPSSIYYSISNNTAAADSASRCFSNGAPHDLKLSKDSIRENLPANSFIGRLTATANPNDQLTYYLSQDQLNDRLFVIHNDSLLSNTTFDYESKKNYDLSILAVNQLGEKIESTFSIKISDLAIEDTALYVITDSTLPSIYYLQQSFITPTKLLYKNLTRVKGNAYFHQNVNLIDVSFPLLESIDGSLYFHQNESLAKINASLLKTVGGYLHVYGNSALTELNVCSLSSILPTSYTTAPYYFVANNNNLDYASTCLRKTNVIFVPVQEIIVKPAPNTFIGQFISDAGITDSMHYYFIDSAGKETTNPDFVIRGDSLFLTKDFAYYANTGISFDINAIRINKAPRRPLGNITSLNEKVSLTVQTDLSQSLRYSTQWIGAGTNPANSAWENPANWSTNKVPDANTDVQIAGGKVIAGTNAICRSLTLLNSANIVVKSPFVLTITH